MESTDVITTLGERDIAGALALSASAHWNQNENDWREMLRLGQGFGICMPDAAGQEVLAASLIVLPYSPKHGHAFSWVSMVLVLPAFQRLGFASMLLRHAVKVLSAQGITPILDATPAGHAVYLQEGFADTWGFARYRREAVEPSASIPSTRVLRDDDWVAIQAIDEPAFGASRMALLHSLAKRLPHAARVAEQQGSLCGYCFARDGREATQIGPLVATEVAVATRLLQDALATQPGTLYLDLLDHQKALLPWLQQRGFVFQRPFTRMVHGMQNPAAPGDPQNIVLAAGPELG